jgi:hypothetical protein
MIFSTATIQTRACLCELVLVLVRIPVLHSLGRVLGLVLGWVAAAVAQA